MRTHVQIFSAGLLAVLLSSCTPLLPPVETPGTPGTPRGGTAPGRIYIVDRYGERFDITHAVGRYGMDQDGFEHGIGKNAIRPLDHPDMIEPGERTYPGPRDRHQVIGTEIDGDVRSYPIHPLATHEIINETIGDTQAAVAY